MIKIPAISGGGPTDRFKKVFWDAVTEKDPKSGLPIRGSIGVHWNVYTDLDSLNTDGGQLLTNLCRLRVNKINPRSVSHDDPFLTKISAGFLAKFYEFANQQTQPYFFIKNGASPLWLARNVGTYEYDGTHEFPHRIRYEIVRVVTEEEGKQRLGDGNKALFMMAPESLPASYATTKSTLESTETSMSTVLEKPKGRPKKTVDATNTVIEPKKGRPKKIVEPTNTAKVVLDNTTKVVSDAPVKRQKKVPTKAPIPVTYAVTTPQILVPEHIETNDEPLSVDSVELVKLTSFDIDGTEFYREPIKNKLFKQNKDGSIGPYVGRWSSKEAKIYEDIPDSDRE
jgi:hypothetical protein